MDNITITIYAPIIIPTLNRYEKLKRLIESLEKNPLAKYTEMYIGVDFPPDDKYVAGYEKVVNYLKEKKFQFKDTYVYYQKSNLGPFENGNFLKNIVFQKYDRYIFLEDDNTVSLNFLEYMNKALEYGKDKPDIFWVSAFSGYYDLPTDITSTAFKTQTVSWGTGGWRDKDIMVEKVADYKWIEDIIHDWKKMFRIYKCNKIVMINFWNNYILKPNPNFYNDDKIWIIDIIAELYMIFNNTYAIMPVVSKIRNYGADGSGQNGGYNEEQCNVELVQPIDLDDKYEFVLETDKTICKRIQKAIRNKRRFGYGEWQALYTFLYSCYYIHIKKGYKKHK